MKLQTTLIVAILALTACTPENVGSFMGTLGAADSILAQDQQAALDRGDTAEALQIADQREDLSQLRDGITAGIAEDGSITPESGLGVIIPFIPEPWRGVVATGGGGGIGLLALMYFLRKRRKKAA